MASRDAKAVWFHDGNDDCYALVLEELGSGNLDLIVFDPDTGVSSLKRDVPRRDPADYDAAGGGHTWH
jgi:hypothetical protein